LVNRGRLTVWFDEEAIAARRKTEPGPRPGAPRRYSDLALECALVLKAIFHLSLRATQGFLASVRELMALALPIPDYNTVAYDYTIKFVTLERFALACVPWY
jgi:Transposase DDE domain